MAGRVLGAFAVAATAGLTVMAMAIPASAHTPDAKADCVKDKAVLTINLKYYAEKGNKILVKDGDTVLEEKTFGENYKKDFTLPGDVEHTFTVVVKASDNSKYDWKKSLETEKCVAPTSSVTIPPSQTSSSVPVPSSETTTPSTTTPAPGGGEAEPPLAATGASTTWTLLAGLGLVGAGAATLILVRRKRA